MMMFMVAVELILTMTVTASMSVLVLCLQLVLCMSGRERGNRSQFRITALDQRDCSDDSAYWLKYSSLLSEKKERVWDALLDGLEKYRYTL